MKPVISPTVTTGAAATRPRPARAFIALSTLLALPVVAVLSTPADAATAKAGAKCTKAGVRSGRLVCTKKGTKLTWAAATTATTTTTGAATASPAPAAAVPAADGVEGAWKATTKSVLGYRVKETLFGQATEGVGRTSAVTGTMTIIGTKATEVTLAVDLTGLKSDDNRRDNQVQGRILETSKFPTATFKSIEPIDFGKVPADKEKVSAKVKASLTLHGVTKTLSFDIAAQRNGATIEVVGSIPITFSEYGIENPSNVAATVGDTGTLEFAVTFAR